jgi:hypothetical protein
MREMCRSRAVCGAFEAALSSGFQSFLVGLGGSGSIASDHAMIEASAQSMDLFPWVSPDRLASSGLVHVISKSSLEVPGCAPSGPSALHDRWSKASFIGRGLELGEIDELLERGRLLTLTGVGGVGKTRLALELARGAGDRFEDGWAVVELAPVGEAASVADALMAALGP